VPGDGIQDSGFTCQETGLTMDDLRFLAAERRFLTLRDVRNEGTTGDVHENKGNGDKMSGEEHGLLHENAPIAR